MNRRFIQWRSLKTKVTLATLTIFMAGIWTLSFYTSRMLREDMQRQLGEQQFATVSMLAAQIDRELEIRLQALRTASDMAAQILRDTPSTLQTFMDQRAALQTLFNGGVVVHDMQGVATRPEDSEALYNVLGFKQNFTGEIVTTAGEFRMIYSAGVNAAVEAALHLRERMRGRR